MGSAPEISVLLDIKIIGAGIAGLAAGLALKRKGHNVTILESMPQLSEFGAGIQLSANATRIIYNWGLQDAFLRVVNQPDVMTVRRYEDNRVVGEIAHNPMSEWQYGYPHWQIYRPDLQNLLAEAAVTAGVRVEYGKAVRDIDPEIGTLTLEDGTILTADVIIGADGIGSRSRSCLTDIQARAFNEYTFRSTLPRAKMELDPITAELMAGHRSMVWVGPSSAVLGYTVAGGTLYNILLTVPRPSDAPLGKWNQPGDLNEIRELLEEKRYCPLVKQLWGLVSSCAKWTLGDVPPIPSYVSTSGRFVLVGDAAHAIIPHVGQGGGMALEDAASLAEFLDELPSRKHIQGKMAAYNTLRKSRVEAIRRMAHGNQRFLTMEDGPEQEERDRLWGAMTAVWKQELGDIGEEGFREKAARVKPDPLAEDIRTPEGRMYAFGYDSIAEARKAAVVAFTGRA